jgi:antirestriction protein ArdC
MSKPNAYEKITAQIIKMLEDGVAPWRKPWNAAGTMPTSLSSGKPYRGANRFILGATAAVLGYGSPYWGTYKQIEGRGGQIVKGAKSTVVTLWKPFEKMNAEGEMVQSMFMTTFNVFNVEQADWTNGEMPTVPEMAEHDPIEDAERIAAAYLADGPAFSTGGDRAYYSPSADSIRVPEMGTFATREGYYSTIFHEMIHSTGHASRLNREGIVEGHSFGDAIYSKEELVAEMGAAFLCATVGTEPEATMANSAAYIKGWLKALKDDPKMIVQAASAAQKAADLVQGIGQATAEEVPKAS